MNVKTRSRLLIIFALTLVTALCLSFTPVKEVLAEGEYTRDLRVTEVTVTVQGKPYNDFYTDPAYYYEEASAGYLNDQKIDYHNVDKSDKVVYTAFYPDTTTGRLGAVREYVCEPDAAGEYVVTKINEAGDGSTYIPVGGFVLSVGGANAETFAKIGDTVKLDKKVKIPK